MFPIRWGLIITLGPHRRVGSADHRARAATDPVRFVPRLAGTVDPCRNLATLLWNHFPALRYNLRVLSYRESEQAAYMQQPICSCSFLADSLPRKEAKLYSRRELPVTALVRRI